MAWRTLYVTGRSGFSEKALHNLERSNINFLTGSINEDGYLFWITDPFVLKDFKLAIGIKVIFKYRLRFFFSVDSFINSKKTGQGNYHFTADQEQMFRDLDD